MNAINRALDTNDLDALSRALEDNTAGLSGVTADNGQWYMQALLEQKRVKQEVPSALALCRSYFP